jgi:hypothetical protein
MDAYERELAALHVKQNRADSITLIVIAGLLFLTGLASLAHTLEQWSHGRIGLDFSILGLIGGPGLLLGKSLGYWFALVITSLQLVGSLGAFTFGVYLMFAGNIPLAGPYQQVVYAEEAALLTGSLLLSGWMVRVLRQQRIRERFGVWRATV